MSLYAFLSMFFFCVAPYGGVGAAVASGLLLGAAPLWIITTVSLSSVLPSLFVPILLDLAQRTPRVAAWVARRRTEKATAFFHRYGIWGMAFVGRLLLGPYAAVLTVEVFGVPRRRSAWIFGLGALAICVVSLLVMKGGALLAS
jgi:hypothetical protein